MYVLTPEAVTIVESDNSSPNIRKLNISVIIQFHLDSGAKGDVKLTFETLYFPQKNKSFLLKPPYRPKM